MLAILGVSSRMTFPRLYCIIDAACFASAPDPVFAACRFAEQLMEAGATLIQYRDKSSDARRFLSCARELRRVTAKKAKLIINDRADLCLASGADGVHLGQDDLSPKSVRSIFSDHQKLWIGYSTHNPSQAQEADSMPVDYIAVGPVFSTSSKAKPDPMIGLDGVRAARAVTQKPLVAIGGITRENCLQVKRAGADSVAVISELLLSPAKAVEDFLRILG